jgi:hypothetical protein
MGSVTPLTLKGWLLEPKTISECAWIFFSPNVRGYGLSGIIAMRGETPCEFPNAEADFLWSMR